MDFLSILVNAVLPIVAIMLVGFLAEKYAMIGENGSSAINNFVLYFAFPVLIFSSTAEANIHQILRWHFILGFVVAMLASYGLAALIAQLFLKKNIVLTSFRALSSSFPNAGFMGIPILLVIFGSKGILPAVIASILSMLVVAVAIYFIESGLHQDQKLLARIKTVCIQLGKNPLLISTVLGIAYSATGLPLPKPIASFCHILGVAAGPAALFSVGQALYGTKVKVVVPGMIMITSIKLVIQPIFTLLLLYWFNVSPLWAASGFILAALPTGSVVYILAAKYAYYQEHSAKVILYTTLISLVTLTIGFYVIAQVWPGLMQLSHI